MKFLIHTIFAMLVASLIGRTATAQEIVQSREGLEVADYKTVPVLIEFPNQQAQNMGLTRDRISARVNLELRKHGLKGIDAEENKARDHYLYVVVHVAGAGFAIDLAFCRRITFVSSGTLYSANGKTWSRLTAGPAERGTDYILGTLPPVLELFVSDYLKANDK